MPDRSLAEKARQVGASISASAREGVEAAVRQTLAQSDRAAYQRSPEQVDALWSEADAWGDE